MKQKGLLRLALISTVLVLLAAFVGYALGQKAEQKSYMSLGFEIQTPTDGVDFTFFMRDFVKSVRRNWYAVMPEDAMLGTKGRVAVKFKISRDGKLEEGSLIVDESSGHKDLDKAALSAIKSAAPFKGFPKEFTGPSIDLRFFFSYNLPLKDPK